MAFLDKTFCASPDCKNECGRKMSEYQEKKRNELMWRNPEIAFGILVSYGYFCGEPDKGEVEDD